ncbi:hypothetical protein LTR56_017518 [Elasticomyces elasticus]|nr:hypothetical protein LTR56_017518 [Elasticomyces elasticus]KAK3665081.1 hypothetical protein LTR22_004137 [Elasticomyces elasticus]KAK4931544.1 hypothetical protein LTR49_001932 [Elasticomyces elasticus]KAK5766704.1 hypothetical protein LTS12_003053 [Elasticomyces elasticus]
MPPNFASHEKLAAPYQVGSTGPEHYSESYQVWPFEQRRLAEFQRLGCHDPEKHEWEAPTAAQEMEDMVQELWDCAGAVPYNSPLPDKMARLRRISKHAEACPVSYNAHLYQHELHRHREEERLITALLSNILPDELLLRILAEISTSVLPELHLTAAAHLPTTARNLLGPIVPTDLLLLTETAILESIPICLRTSSDAQNPVPRLPDFALPFVHKIRTLVLRTAIMPGPGAVTHKGLDHPISAMPSLSTQLPLLHELRVAVRVDGHFRCRKQALAAPYDGEVSHWGVLERLVQAMLDKRVGERGRMLLQMCFSCEGRCKGSNVVVIDGRTPAEIVEEAVVVTGAVRGKGRKGRVGRV